ncbi:MAG TPA: DUF6632 domain-containing protein [Methylomirabilota bacterium]|nr:DUF6632 domain-containing protein [Methylomirabilota bacterium]
MIRERVLKVVLGIVGLLFVAGIYPIAMYLWQPGNEAPGDTMMLSLYFTLGIFLLLAVRDPSAYRSLIFYAGWANIAHATVMALMAIRPNSDRRGLLIAAAGFSFIGVALLVLAPAKEQRQELNHGVSKETAVVDSAQTQSRSR